MAAASTTTNDQVSIIPPHIHDDIALSILSKLPLKSLTRFTCAQKTWSLLFQNPIFMNMFRANFLLSKHDEDEDNTHLLMKDHHNPYTFSGESFESTVRLDWPPAFNEYDSCIEILGSASVNGILCLYEDYDDDSITVLWNPTTGEFKTIPPSLQPYDNIEFNHPPVSFGYDYVRDDYKMIRHVEYPLYFEGNWVYLPNKGDPFWETDVHELNMDDKFWEEKELIVGMYDPFWEIYSLRSNSWKKLDGADMPVSYPNLMVNLNGFCHWLSQGDYMVSFDFSKDVFFATTLPFDLDVPLKCSKSELMVLNGSISLISNYSEAIYFHIWILGELGVTESWTKLFVVGPLPCVMCPLSTWKSRIFFKKPNLELACFDFITQRIEKIAVKGDSNCLLIVIYKENLIPFGGMNN